MVVLLRRPLFQYFTHWHWNTDCEICKCRQYVNAFWMRHSTLESQVSHEIHVWDHFVAEFGVFETVVSWNVWFFCAFDMFKFKKLGRCLWDVYDICFEFLRFFEMFARSGHWRPIPIIAKTGSAVKKLSKALVYKHNMPMNRTPSIWAYIAWRAGKKPTRYCCGRHSAAAEKAKVPNQNRWYFLPRAMDVH